MISDRKRVLFDCDGILSDFLGAVLKAVRNKLGKTHKEEDVVVWDICSALNFDFEERVFFSDLMSSRYFCSQLEVCPGAVEAVCEYKRDYEIAVVTTPAPRSGWWVPERTWWLDYHFAIEHQRVIFTSEKTWVAGDYFIEDEGTNAFNYAKYYPNSTVLLWDKPYNRQVKELPNLIRVSSWEDVFKIIP